MTGRDSATTPASHPLACLLREPDALIDVYTQRHAHCFFHCHPTYLLLEGNYSQWWSIHIKEEGQRKCQCHARNSRSSCWKAAYIVCHTLQGNQASSLLTLALKLPYKRNPVMLEEPQILTRPALV